MNRRAGILRRDGRQGHGEEGHEQLSSDAGTSAHSLTLTGTYPQRRVDSPLAQLTEHSDLQLLEICTCAWNYGTCLTCLEEAASLT